MINEIPSRIREAAKAVTRRHPNSIDCVVYRKVFTRKNESGDKLGGIPTHGGMGVLTPEDEDLFTYEKMGKGRILIVSRFDGNIDMSDRKDSWIPADEMQEALIEPNEGQKFTVHKYDLIGAMPGGGVLIGFEVMSIPTTVAIAPYTQKYIIAPRDELHDLGPWEDPA